jgi:hypothetical protein
MKINRDTYLFDIDGTLAHRGDRDPYDDLNASTDIFDKSVGNTLCHLLDAGCIIIILTGRKERSRNVLTKWLLNHLGSRYFNMIENILMRADDDYRKDAAVKRQMYEKHILNRYNLQAVFDDRDQVVKMWRSLGIKCFQVQTGNF